MDNLSPFQKLDLILSYLDYTKPTYIQDLQNKLNLQSNESAFEIEMILNKLVKDEYAHKTDTKVEYELPENLRYLADPIFYFKTTFEGEYIKTTHPYQELQNQREALRLQKISENKRLVKLEKSQKEYQTNMIWLTAILSVGTTIAAAYYFLGIYDNHRCFSYWLCGAIIGLLLTAIVYLIFRKRNK